MSNFELEIEVKVRKLPENPEDLAQEEAERIIGKKSILDMDLNDDTKFEYRRLVIKLNQLDGRGDFDGVHTVLYFPHGVYLAKVPFDHFNIIYESIMGIQIKRVSDYRFTLSDSLSEEGGFKRTRRRKPLDEE